MEKNVVCITAVIVVVDVVINKHSLRVLGFLDKIDLMNNYSYITK